MCSCVRWLCGCLRVVWCCPCEVCRADLRCVCSSWLSLDPTLAYSKSISRAHTGPVTALHFPADVPRPGSLLLSSGADSCMLLWDMDSYTNKVRGRAPLWVCCLCAPFAAVTSPTRSCGCSWWGTVGCKTAGSTGRRSPLPVSRAGAHWCFIPTVSALITNAKTSVCA